MKNMCKAFESLFQRRIFEKIYLCSTHKYLMDTMHKRKNYMYGIFARRHNEFRYDFVIRLFSFEFICCIFKLVWNTSRVVNVGINVSEF